MITALCVVLWLLLGPITRTVLFSSNTSEDVPVVLDTVDRPVIAQGSASSDVILAAPSSPQAKVKQMPKPVPASRRTALIVGVNNAAGSRPLLGAVKDANNLNKALLQYGFPKENVTVLLDGEATRARVLDELTALAGRTPRDGLAVFAIASHTRKHAGQNQLVAADGGLISAGELAGRLAAVRSKMWVAFPTCYAGGYELPGIVGKNRIATFASPPDRPSYELGSAGSYLFINMVRKAMIEGAAPTSVESAFRFAEERLRRTAPNRVPYMKDGVRGDLALGPVTWKRVVRLAEEKRAPAPDRVDAPDDDQAYAPQPTPAPNTHRRRIGVCGRIAINC